MQLGGIFLRENKSSPFCRVGLVRVRGLGGRPAPPPGGREDTATPTHVAAPPRGRGRGSKSPWTWVLLQRPAPLARATQPLRALGNILGLTLRLLLLPVCQAGRSGERGRAARARGAEAWRGRRPEPAGWTAGRRGKGRCRVSVGAAAPAHNAASAPADWLPGPRRRFPEKHQPTQK